MEAANPIGSKSQFTPVMQKADIWSASPHDNRCV